VSSDPSTLLASVLSEAVTSTSVGALGERPLAAPARLEEWSDVIRLAREQRWSLLVTGFGSKLGWCAPPGQVDLVLSTRAFEGVTSYEPGDGTLTARAGTSMAALADTVAAGGHHLTPDVARPDVASLGGVIGAGASGVDRLACGPLRHNLLGTTVCLADGSRTKSGGQLVKNVTGYDLHRLYCGSQGTLCVVLEASLRLYPLPATRAALMRSFASQAEALAMARRVLDLPLHPHSLTIDRRERDWRLLILLAGRGDVVDWEVRRLEEIVDGLERLEGARARELQREVRDLESPEASRPQLWIGCPPSRLAAALNRAKPIATELEARTLIHPGIAYATITFDEVPRRAMEELGRELRESRVNARWRNAGELRSHPPHGLPLMQNLKRALDPQGLFAPGRLHGI